MGTWGCSAATLQEDPEEGTEEKTKERMVDRALARRRGGKMQELSARTTSFLQIIIRKKGK